MSSYAQLLPEQKGLFVGLFYRTGIWISHADDDAGEGDDVREMKSLEKIINYFAGAEDQNEFVREVATQVMARKESWPKWAAHSFDILADAERAIEVAKTALPEDDMKAYRAALLRVAETVAAAHGEFGFDASGDEEGFSALLGRIIGKFKADEEPEIDVSNISPSEGDAIQRLRTATRLRD